jgi:hypothetical protein
MIKHGIVINHADAAKSSEYLEIENLNFNRIL